MDDSFLFDVRMCSQKITCTVACAHLGCPLHNQAAAVQVRAGNSLQCRLRLLLRRKVHESKAPVRGRSAAHWTFSIILELKLLLHSRHD